MEKQFQWGDNVLHYQKYGKGANILLCFHGYGQDAHVFKLFERAIGSSVTLFSFTLPFHGDVSDQDLKGSMNIEVVYLDLIESFFKEKVKPETHLPVNFLGYSLGGNYVMALCKRINHPIKNVFLLASDGLRPNYSMRFLTSTHLGILFFKGFVQFPQPVQLLISLARIAHILQPKVASYYLFSIQTRLKRRLLFLRWKSASKAYWQGNSFVETINAKNIRLVLVHGKDDKMIPVDWAVKMKRKSRICELVLLDAGHDLIKRDVTNMWLETRWFED